MNGFHFVFEVLDQVFEVNYKAKTRQDLGMILLKGDCVSLIRSLNPTD